MTIVTAAPIRFRMSKILEVALVYATVSPPEITSAAPIKVSCPNFMPSPPHILLASCTKSVRPLCRCSDDPVNDLGEPLDEVERRLSDLAPAVVDREAVAPVRDLHNLRHGGVAPSPLPGGRVDGRRDDSAGQACAEAREESQQGRRAIGVPVSPQRYVAVTQGQPIAQVKTTNAGGYVALQAGGHRFWRAARQATSPPYGAG